MEKQKRLVYIGLFLFIILAISYFFSIYIKNRNISKQTAETKIEDSIKSTLKEYDIKVKRTLFFSENFEEEKELDWTPVSGIWRTYVGEYTVEFKVWQFGETNFPGKGDSQLNFPVDAQRLSNGNTLICDLNNSRVIEVFQGIVTWQLGNEQNLKRPMSSQRLSEGNTLISDSDNHRVIEITRNGKKVWQFGKTGVNGSDNYHLNYPQSSQRLSNGNTLICDTENHRVIEVTKAGKKVWQFGTTGVSGKDDSFLNNPAEAYRLSNGNTLITDSYNQRVVEINPKGEKVWQFGKTGVSDDKASCLFYPISARRMDDNSTLIADTGHHRVVKVDSKGIILWQFGLTGENGPGEDRISNPYRAVALPNGNILICDSGKSRVIEITPNKQGAISIHKNPHNNFVLQVQVKEVIGGAIDNKIYVYFGYRDKQNFYALELDYADSYARLINVEKDIRNVLKEIKYKLVKQREYNAVIVVNENNCEVLIDGKKLFDGNLGAFQTGHIGIGATGQVKPYFDDITIWKIKGDKS